MRCFFSWRVGRARALIQIKDKQTNVDDAAREPKDKSQLFNLHWPLNKARKINNNVKLVRETLKNCKEHEINSHLMPVKDHCGDVREVQWQAVRPNNHSFNLHYPNLSMLPPQCTFRSIKNRKKHKTRTKTNISTTKRFEITWKSTLGARNIQQKSRKEHGETKKKQNRIVKWNWMIKSFQFISIARPQSQKKTRCKKVRKYYEGWLSV
jgi:hypothetical protein